VEKLVQDDKYKAEDLLKNVETKQKYKMDKCFYGL
jgi:hypothetical protein